MVLLINTCKAPAYQGIWMLRPVFDPDHFHDTRNFLIEQRFNNIRGDIPGPDAGSSGGKIISASFAVFRY